MNGDTIGQQIWVETWARRIETLGLSAVAVPMFELVRAFGRLGSQVIFLIQPFMVGTAGGSTLSKTAQMLEDPAFYEQLTLYLDSVEGEVEE